MMKFSANVASWLASGRKAAESGNRNEALYAICTLLSMLFSAVDVIIGNQFEIYNAIVKIQPPGQLTAQARNGNPK